MTYLMKRIICYSVGTFFIILFFAFHLLPYSIAMSLATLSLVVALVVEIKESMEQNKQFLARFKSTLVVFLLIGVAIILLLGL